MKVRLKVRLFYSEAWGGLIEGWDEWGSNDDCWLYLEKGSIGVGEDIEDEFDFGTHTTTICEDWVEIIG